MTAATRGSGRITQAFTAARATGRIGFVPYVVAGYPDYPTSERIALAAVDTGADVLEVGLPYSDPLADGVTLQRASTLALANGATLDRSLDLVGRIATGSKKPIVVMGYANQFLGPRGPAAISQRLADAGACGAIVADLTPDEGAPLESAFMRNDLALIYLIAPTTSSARAVMIARRSGGFVYCVSLSGVTGARNGAPRQLGRVVSLVKSATALPVAVGFGVAKPAHVRAIKRSGADGVIVGSVLVDALGPRGTDVDGFVGAMCALSEAA